MLSEGMKEWPPAMASEVRTLIKKHKKRESPDLIPAELFKMDPDWWAQILATELL